MYGKEKEILDDDLINKIENNENTIIENIESVVENESRNEPDAYEDGGLNEENIKENKDVELNGEDLKENHDDMDDDELDDDMDDEDDGRGDKFMTFLSVILVIAILGVFGFGVYSIYSKFEKKPEVAVVNDDGTVVVPRIVGMTQTDAEKVLKNTELGLKKNRYVISEEPEGTIIYQEPADGESVDPYTTILYDVSSGTAEAIMPDVTNIELYQAIQVLDEMNISNVKTEKSYDESFGMVTRTEPQAGANITSKDEVVLHVGAGPQTIAAPDKYIGMDEESAIEKATHDKLIPIVKYAFSNSDGIVIDQSVEKNAPVMAGTEVVLTVSRNKEFEISNSIQVDLGIPETATGTPYRIVAKEWTDYEMIEMELESGDEAPAFPYQIEVPLVTGVKKCVLTYYELAGDAYVPRANWTLSLKKK